MAATTSSGSTTAREDRALGFADAQVDEVRIDDLEVSGSLPEWLGGSLLRTGPARWDLGRQTVRHWFDGLAQLHRFTFAGGKVGYGSRFLRSRAFAHAEREGEVGFREFATDPCRSAFKRVVALFDADLTDNGAVNVTRLGERFLALTETPLPVAFDPETLEAHGVQGRPPVDVASAHPHHDPVRGELVSHGTHLRGRSSYVIFAQRDLEDRRVVARFPAGRPAYHHAFGLTPDHAVLAESPFRTSPLRLGLGGKAFIESFAWDPGEPGRFLVAHRDSGRTVRAWSTEPFFCFHHVNAFEAGDELVVDLLAYDDPAIVHALGLGRLRDGEAPPLPELRRYRLPLAQPGARVEPEVLTDVRFELPRIDYGRANGRPHRVVFGVGAAGGGAHGLFERVVRVDVATGEHRGWEEPGTFPGEPVFVPRPQGTREGDGVLLCVLLETERRASALLVLDATSLTELARARVPHHIPFGFHGQHFG